MIKTCAQCGSNFELTEEYLKSLEKFTTVIGEKKYPMPAPELCPDCRQQRRIANRNERKFYKRKCDLTGSEIVTIYSPDKEVVVYRLEDWWSDKWDGLEFGRDFYFDKTFFEQFENLSKVVPRPPMVNMFNENSLYTNHSAYLKNCYMCMNTGWCEDCMYLGNYNLYNKNCMDCVAIQNGELCYFCTNTKVATNSNYLYECINCHDSSFLYDCHSCSNCFMCFNLRHKQFHILNKGYCENEYKQKLKELMPKTAEEYEKTFQEYKDMMAQKAIHKYIVTENCENSNGDNLFNNKNVKDSYYAFGNEDIAYCYDCGNVKDSMDATEPFGGEIQYETHGCNNGYNLIGCSKCYECHDIFYSQYC
ncbi:MAG: hypothetical protein PHP74_03360 [Candidatus Gracilibacteria bacterium]|nr:hypothetical protein [Candidatus Gracilibacteria bacterium]